MLGEILIYKRSVKSLEGGNSLKKYIKGYSLGVLLGLLFCSSAFIVDVSFSFRQHWYALVIFLPAVLYFIFSYSEYNEVSFKKENIKKSIPFIIGLVLSSYAIYSIWGLPDLLNN